MKYDKYIAQEFSLAPSLQSWFPIITFIASLLGLLPLIIALLLAEKTILASIPLWAYGLWSFAVFLFGLYTEKINANCWSPQIRWLNSIGIILSLFEMLLYLYGLPLLS